VILSKTKKSMEEDLDSFEDDLEKSMM